MVLFEALTRTYDILSYPAYAAMNNNIEDGPRSEIVRVNNDWKRKNDAPPSMIDECKTVPDLLRKIVETFGDKDMLATRAILSKEQIITSSGKTLNVRELEDEYTTTSCEDVYEEVQDLMKGFRSIGIKPKDRVIVFMDTRKEWAISAYAMFNMNTVIATLYATLGDSGVISGVNQTEATHIITSNELLPKLVKLLPQMKTLKHVIVVTDVVGGRQEEICLNPAEGVTFHRFDQVLLAGEESEETFEDGTANSEDVALIMFTSGSTGDPKGVVMSHGTFLAAIKNIAHNVTYYEDDFEIVGNYMSYLPMAHIMELISHFTMSSLGLVLCYGTPTTLVKGAPGLKRGCISDLELAKPVIMAAVPLMVDRLRKAVELNGKEALGDIFDKFLAYKREWNNNGKNTPLIDSLLLSKARSILGGNLKVMICGGAPLSEETQVFCRDVFGLKMNLAWASTETCGAGCFMEGHDRYVGRVGVPLDGVTIRLQDWAEGGYTLQDKPNPRGEVLVGSKSIALEYFKNPEASAEAFMTDEDGNRWWVSGDIFESYPDGTFKVIDRKKDLVKLQFGEYVSLGKCEAELHGCPIVDNLCVVADSFHSFTIALILPNVKELANLAKTLGKNTENLSLEEMCNDPEIQAASLDFVAKTGKKAGLVGVEIPKVIKLLTDHWTPDNGLVTAALKIRRKQVAEHYSALIKEMFSK